MAQYELNLRDYIRILKKRKLVVVLTLILTILLFAFCSSRQTPVYQASTTVKYEERKTMAGLLTEWITYNPGNILASQVKIIKGYPIMRKAALQMGLIGEDSSLASVNKTVTRLSSKVATQLVGSTNIIRITATSADPEEALLLANTVAQVYVEENLLEKNKQARRVREFVEEQLSSLKERLEGAEDTLRVFSEEIENVHIAQPIQDKLVDLEFQLASFLQRYTEKHPKVLQVKQQISQLKKQIEGFSSEQLEYARLVREVEVNKKLYAMLKEKLEQARITEAEKVPDVSIVDPAVIPSSIGGASGSFVLFLGGIVGLLLGSLLAFVRETLDTSIGTIEEVERITRLPVLGVIPSIDRGAKRARGLHRLIKNRLLPRKKSDEEEAYTRLIVHYRPSAPMTEAFRNIRTNLKLSPSKKIILIASSSPQEGKTTILTNLGLATAQEGQRTLLVSSDLRRPALAKTFGIDQRPGLVDVLSGLTPLKDALRNIIDIMLGNMAFEEIIKPSGLRNIWILPSGFIPHNPAEILASERLASLVEQLRQEFDVVFFDSPPVLPVTDASLIASLADSVILCHEVGRVSREALLRCKSQLESINADISGVVLNHTKPQTEPIEPYPYYYRYKKYGYYKQKERQKV